MSADEWRTIQDAEARMRAAESSSAAPFRDPRAELAMAIEEHARAGSVLASISAATERALSAVASAQAELDATAQTMIDARVRAVASHVSGLLADAPPDTQDDLRAARTASGDAEEALATAQAARAELRTRHAQAQSDVAAASTRVSRAARAVLRAEGAAAASALARSMLAMHTTLIACHAELRWLVEQGVIRSDDASVRLAMDRHASPPSTWTAIALDPSPIVRWTDALEALQRDASAPLPTPAPPGAPS
jgi:hypothetical protein